MLFWKRKVLLFKSEVTPGTDSVPTAAVNGILVRNVALSPLEQEGEQRELDVNYVGNKGFIVAGAFQKLSCEVELAGAGAAGTVPGRSSKRARLPRRSPAASPSHTRR